MFAFVCCQMGSAPIAEPQMLGGRLSTTALEAAGVVANTPWNGAQGRKHTSPPRGIMCRLQANGGLMHAIVCRF